MKKVFSIMFVLLILIAFVPSLSFSQDDIRCCCNVQCKYEQVWGPGKGSEPVIKIDKCWTIININYIQNCYPDYICKRRTSVFDKYTDGNYTGTCNLACPSETALGESHPGLDALRRFRDRELTKTAVGNKLKDLYYEYAGTLTEVFIENPSLGEHAGALLEKLIPQIQAALKGTAKGPVLDGDLYAEAEMLLDEIDSVLTSPLKKDLMALKDEAREQR